MLQQILEFPRKRVISNYNEQVENSGKSLHMRPVCLDVLKRKSTAGVSSLPFLTAAICTNLWLQYGILVEDTVLAVVNAIAVSMQVCYLAMFYYSTDLKATLQRWLTSSTIFLLSVYAYSSYLAAEQTGIQTLGVLASLGSVLTAAAPLTGVGKVFRNRSSEGLPFLIILATFIVNILWYTYGVLIDDTFVKVPNFIGSLLSGFQLSLFAIFDSEQQKGKSD